LGERLTEVKTDKKDTPLADLVTGHNGSPGATGHFASGNASDGAASKKLWAWAIGDKPIRDVALQPTY
jgi:hypothetical protein